MPTRKGKPSYNITVVLEDDGLEIEEQNQNLSQRQEPFKKSIRAVLASREATRNKGCSQRVYLYIVFVLFTILIAEYIFQLKITNQSNQRFLDNVQTLRKSFSYESPQRQKISSNVNVDSLMDAKTFKDQKKKKISFNINQLNIQEILTEEERGEIVKDTQAFATTPVELHRPNFNNLGEEIILPIQNDLPAQPTLLYQPQPQPMHPFVPFEASNLQPNPPNDLPMNPISLNQHADNHNQNNGDPLGLKSRLQAYPAIPQGSTKPPTPATTFISPPVLNPLPVPPKQQLNSIEPTIRPFAGAVTGAPNIQPSSSDGVADISNNLLPRMKQRRKLTSMDVSDFSSPIVQEELIYYQSKYQISKYEELPFCVVVPTFNNAPNQRYLRNINSILMQNYSKFHIVVIDDHSDDNTGELIRKRLETQQRVPSSRYTVIRNEKQMRAMGSLRTAAKEHCSPQEIFMVVDGDDELLGRQVLKVFNAVFQEKKLWFVYSNFLTTTGNVGYSRPFPPTAIQQNNYRSYPFVTSHLRAFYTQLFLNIKESDLRDDQGEYFKAANDVAICIPVLQQAHQRVAYLPQVTYYYNSDTGNNNHQVRFQEQRTNDAKTRTRAKYQRLEKLEP